MKRVILSVLVFWLSSSFAHTQAWFNHGTQEGINNLNVSTVLIDGTENKWVGTIGGGIFHFNGTQWISFNSGTSNLPHNTVYSSAIDKNGVLWFGGILGVCKYEANTLTAYTNAMGSFQMLRVFDIAVDNYNNKWFGTNRGLIKYDGNSFTVYTPQNSGMPEELVNTVCFDSIGRMWIGFNNSGIALWHNNNWTYINTFNSNLYSNRIYSIAFDAEFNIWVGTDRGFSRYKSGVWTSFLIQGGVQKIFIDQDDNKWFGTFNGVALLTANGQWTEFNTSNSGIGGNSVQDITMNSNCEMWFATNGGASVLSNCLNVQENKIVDVSIVPNPTRDYLTLNFSDFYNKYTIALYSSDGKRLQSHVTESSDFRIDLSSYSNGIYYLKINSENSETYHKIIKN